MNTTRRGPPVPTPLLLPLLLLASVAAGCGSTERYKWSPPVQVPKEVLLSQAKEALKDKKLKTENVAEGTLEYEWEEVLHYFRFEGKRKKVFVKVENREKGKPVFALGVMIRQQRNDDIVDPIDPERADWSDEGFDEVEEDLLLYRILKRISPGEEEPASADWLKRQEQNERMMRKLDEYIDRHKFEEPKK